MERNNGTALLETWPAVVQMSLHTWGWMEQIIYQFSVDDTYINLLAYANAMMAGILEKKFLFDLIMFST